ncbi:PepSY domain-containing protein [Pseudomonas sp. ZM23]|uniref:PepSY-associated TM helix domain-containing protein n=1 Tax=Pseudomonas triclosanedens TaxID=2961893 RepID=A0ABY6ZW10_9PSED|nr:PepSY-associated TM helix domain-containing protein [Pseudomonas triclosanedens]MCP8463266.1 PepSY domain-containing protein [Pseudomonas triclosanedens]MCP8469675.1 PepSY domain-containing protein [Pseudomonas triclosanedens]MCP8474068.1 PepSY domain-containing protein [Pseudomonas triclosanedens]WAI48536.1 PepSY-associated TM helix domain-containing protein [Pseudomonas triclosanedens]
MSLRQSMSGLHTWSGLLISWILFVVLFSGTVAVFDKELTRWMTPQLQRLEQVQVGADRIRDLIVERAPKAHGYWMHPPTERMPYWTAGWEPADLGEFQSFLVDAQSGQVLPGTVGGNFFLELHYELHGGMLGLYTVGIAGVFMLVALVSGAIVHRRIFKDFFTLRPKAAKQRAWLDAHNVLGVLGLPFHLLMAYTGLAIFITFYMTAGIKVAYKNDAEHFFHEVQGAFDREELGKPAKPPKSIDRMITKAHEAWGDDSQVGWINIEHPNDAAAMVQIRRAVDRSMVNDQRTVSFDSGTGALLHVQPPYKPGYHTYAWLTGLHMAQFGNELLRVMYFLLGLVGCTMVFGGLQVWVSKREARGHRGVVLVRVLNGAVCGGLPLASLGLLAVSRLLPVEMAGRERWEATAFVAAWLLALAHALWRRGGRGMAREQCGAMAGLALLLPVLGLFGPEPGRLTTRIAESDWLMAGIELGLLLIGALCAFLAWRLGQERAEPVRGRGARNEEYA